MRNCKIKTLAPYRAQARYRNVKKTLENYKPVELDAILTQYDGLCKKDETNQNQAEIKFTSTFH